MVFSRPFKDQLSPWGSFMKAKYYRAEHLVVVQFCYSASPFWRRLCCICCVIMPYVQCMITCGLVVFGMIAIWALDHYSYIILVRHPWCQFSFIEGALSRIRESFQMFYLPQLLSIFY